MKINFSQQKKERLTIRKSKLVLINRICFSTMRYLQDYVY